MTSSNRQRHRPRRSTRRLQIEALEDRSLLAVAALSINLLEDADGMPGEPLAEESVAAGDSFFVEIMAQEFHPLYTGLQGVSLDLDWDPAALEIVEGSFDPQSAVTGALPLFLSGTLDAEHGAITNLGGSAFPAWNVGHPIGDGAPERFAVLHFRALQPTAGTSISMAQGASAIATMPVSNLASSLVSFERQSLAVVPAAVETEIPASPSSLAFEEPAPIDVPAPTDKADEQPVTPPPTAPLPANVDCSAGEATSPAGEPADLPSPVEPVIEILDVADSKPERQPAEPYDLPVTSVEIEPENEPAPADPTADCPSPISLTDAIDSVFMGPLALDQQVPFVASLEELIAMLAAEIDQRRTARNAQSTVVVCP